MKIDYRVGGFEKGQNIVTLEWPLIRSISFITRVYLISIIVKKCNFVEVEFTF